MNTAPRWVDQGPGECWIACAASLTGIPLEEFPKPPADAREAGNKAEIEYQTGVRKFLMSRAWLLQTTWRMAPLGYAIATGKSPRDGSLCHCVITLAGELVHDPHPTRAGLGGPVIEYEILVQLAEPCTP